MSAPPSSDSVNSAAVSGRLRINPPKTPESSLWYSDREIGARRPRAALSYTADDFRSELSRVEKKLYWLSFTSVAIAVLAVAAIVFVVLQTGISGA